ncbi:MAG: hypothetical protein ACFFEV_06190, partial [Candidatus Thorarchaeota archaeon]
MDENPRIKVKLKEDNVELSTFIKKVEDFESSYRMLKKLDEKRYEIDNALAIESELEAIKPSIISAQNQTSHFWSDTGEWTYPIKIGDPFDNAVLVLLRI